MGKGSQLQDNKNLTRTWMTNNVASVYKVLLLVLVLVLLGSVLELSPLSVYELTDADVHPRYKGFLHKGPGSSGQYSTDLEVVKGLTSKSECFQNKGSWHFQPAPRDIAWDVTCRKELQTCDLHYMAQLSINRTGHLGKLAGQAHWFVRDALKFHWDTGSQDCPTLPVNRTNFCHLIGPRKRILVLGDSMSEHFTSALKSHLHWTFGNKAETRTLLSAETTCTPPVDLCADVFPTSSHEESETVKFVRSDQLSLSEESTWVGNTRHEPWLHELTLETALVIFNQGLHIQTDGNFSKSLTAAIRLIKDRLPHALLIFVSTSIGHLNCESYEGPLAVEQSNDELPYGWDNVRRQNGIAKKIAADLGVVFMDVFRMTALRPDSHLKPSQDQDCLHYCAPGPLDAWVSVLYNLLLEHATLHKR